MSNLARIIPAELDAVIASEARADRNPARVYLASLAPGSRPTMRSSLDRIAAFLSAPSIDECRWHALRFAHTQAIRSWVLERFAPSTANRYLAAVRGVLRAAYELELLEEPDYRRAVKLPTIRGARLPAGRAITQGELRSLFLACKASKSALGARDAALLAVCYGAGLRRAEAIGLNVDDVAELVELGQKRLGLVVRGKGQKDRKVYLGAGGAGALKAWLIVRGIEPGPLLLPCTKAGEIDEPRRRLSGETVAFIMERLARVAGVAHFSPHDLRRTFVGDLLEAGADIKTVADLAGHAQVSTTARYDRRGEASKIRAAELLSIPFGDGEPPEGRPLRPQPPRAR